MTDAEPPIETGKTPADWDGVADLLNVVFHDVRNDEARELNRATYEPARSLLVRDRGVVVAHAGAFTRELTVPGAVLSAGHVTQVGVAPTHRRRGLLTRLMRKQLQDIRAGGESIAVLWASESAIYPRFGYGMAAQRLTMEIDTRSVGLPPGGEPRLRMGEAGPLHEALVGVYDRLRAGRPGWSSRDARWWRRLLDDPPAQRHGAAARHAVLYEDADGVAGYALYRARNHWDNWSPRGQVQVDEVAAGTPEAYAQLWRFLLTIDLTRTTSYQNGTVDEPLQHLVADPRALHTQVLDGLWVRVVDVGAALAARRYATPVDVVLEVTDPLLGENAGRWRLTGDGTGAACARTADPADLSCGIADLGAVFLGGPGLSALAAAGRVRELRPGAVAAAGPAFGWHRAPASIEVF
ncbi:GNAT family N-acetyltransferase [Solwaraspora sp. WMMD1047]|uniref:GNAT family N-acetyltransferase n=1 Tax=Solwaraspora sp. WMMD1047 TaxID=3016102 RepID=UPI0024163535|nr:GNAT family N-acetyltransferase [Solwaraspora sp. WMMD1047]MDG4832863.1 GNAT family N-acetyltransferase [Solwaraspora sp. WMMD1047]